MSERDPKAPELSVLILVGDRAENLTGLHAELEDRLRKLGHRYELVYLLGSSSGLRDEVLALKDDQPEGVRVLLFEDRVGDGARLAAGFDRAHGDVIFTLPGEFDTDPSGLEDLYLAIRDGADVAFASRVGWTSGGVARLQSRLFNKLASWLTDTGFHDIANRTRVIRREAVEEIPLYGDFHRYLPLLAHSAGFNVREIPVRRHPRAESSRSFHTPRIYLWRAMDLLSILFLSRFTRRPLRLFGGVGAAFGGVGALILAKVGLERLLGIAPADRPILVLGTLLVGIGVQAITIGLLGELLLFFHARKIRDYRVSQVYEAKDPPLEG